MQLTYKLSLADYKAALALHDRQKFTRRLGHTFLFIVMPSLAVLVLLFQGYLAFTQVGYIARNPPVTLVVFFVFLLLPALRLYGTHKQFSRLFSNSPTDRSVSIDIDEERIISAIPGRSEGKFFWQAILKFAQDEKGTLFYIAENRFLFIPTQALSSAQRDELADLVARHLPSGKS
jgi:hypothetical protein